MRTPTITQAQAAWISDYVNDHELNYGVGTNESPGSIAAINLALTGKLTNEIPNCMSVVVGLWVKHVSHAIPRAIRNAPDWKNLLPLAAGTGRWQEKRRAAVALDWMWSVLAQMQYAADVGKFAKTWQAMCQEKTSDAAFAAFVATTKADCRTYCAPGKASSAALAQRHRHIDFNELKHAAIFAAYATNNSFLLKHHASCWHCCDADQNRAEFAAQACIKASLAEGANAANAAFWAKANPAACLARMIEVQP